MRQQAFKIQLGERKKEDTTRQMNLPRPYFNISIV